MPNRGKLRNAEVEPARLLGNRLQVEVDLALFIQSRLVWAGLWSAARGNEHQQDRHAEDESRDHGRPLTDSQWLEKAMLLDPISERVVGDVQQLGRFGLIVLRLHEGLLDQILFQRFE